MDYIERTKSLIFQLNGIYGDYNEAEMISGLQSIIGRAGELKNKEDKLAASRLFKIAHKLNDILEDEELFPEY